MLNLKEIQDFAPFCLSCLGRTVGKIGFGLDNRERGIEIINQLEIQEDVCLEDTLISNDVDCKICDGLISEIPNFVELVSSSMSEYSISSFKIGTIVDKDLLSRESDFQLVFGENIGESIKSQLKNCGYFYEIQAGSFDTKSKSKQLEYSGDTAYNNYLQDNHKKVIVAKDAIQSLVEGIEQRQTES